MVSKCQDVLHTRKQNSYLTGGLYMKRHIKIALVICCAAISPLLSSKAATVQVRVGAGGLRFNPPNVAIQVGDTVQWNWVANGHSSTSGTPGNPDGIWDYGVQNSASIPNHTISP